MFALCLETSHARGMGHFYRMLNLAEALKSSGYNYKFFLNEHLPSQEILQSRSYDYEVVDLMDLASDWEEKAINQDSIRIWVNDRLDTNISHAKKIKACNIPLATFDDRGSGAILSDLNIAALAFDKTEALSGEHVLRGLDYLILNPEIAQYKRLRKSIESIIVTLGGSDTYGVTVDVVRMLVEKKMEATVIVGPAYKHIAELEKVKTKAIKIKHGVDSLIKEFSKHDLAITGGGITPFEANASGLPCIVIANEIFEIPVGKELERMGGAIFAGYYPELNSLVLNVDVSIEIMSRAAMAHVGLNGCERVVQALSDIIH